MQGARAPTLAVKFPHAPLQKKKRCRPSGVKSPRSLISLRGILLNTAVQPSGALRKSPRGCGDPGPRNGRPLLVTGQGGLTVGAVPSRGRGEGAKQRSRESLLFFCFSECVTDRRRDLRGLGRARRGPGSGSCNPTL